MKSHRLVWTSARRRAFWLLSSIAAVASFGVQASEGKATHALAPDAVETPMQTIQSQGPLRSIFVGNDASTQIAHVADALYEVYPPQTAPADFGTFLVVADVLYAPDFSAHGTTATGDIGTFTPFTAQNQSNVTGSGTEADPFKVTTVVRAGNSGITLTQADSYVTGRESYRTDVTLSNSGSTSVSTILYRALDCYLGGSDTGYGDSSGNTIACKASPGSTSPGRLQQFVPLTGGADRYEASYSEVWAAIGTHQRFNNTCRCSEEVDNAIGISWSVSLAPGANATRSHMTLLSAGSETECGPTPVSIGISPLTAAINQNILFTARAGIHAPFGGTMSFTIGEESGAIVCTNAMFDVASSCIGSLASGSYSIIARYSGDAFNAPGCSPPQTLTVVNDPADILTVIAIQAESLHGHQGRPTEIKATVTPTGMVPLAPAFPAGTIDGFVTFAYGDDVLADVPIVDGSASLTMTFPQGGYPITVMYSGDASYVTSVQTSTIEIIATTDDLFYGGFDIGPPPE